DNKRAKNKINALYCAETYLISVHLSVTILALRVTEYLTLSSTTFLFIAYLLINIFTENVSTSKIVFTPTAFIFRIGSDPISFAAIGKNRIHFRDIFCFNYHKLYKKVFICR